MTEPIFSTAFWKDRLDRCDGEIHRAIFRGSIDQFAPIHETHRRTLEWEIRATDSILDAGCGYGRILDAMPPTWRGKYLGVDLSPDLIAVARQRYPERRFLMADLRDLSSIGERFDVAIVASIKTMVIRNAGQESWDKMAAELRRHSKRILYLTYGQWD